MSKNQYRSPQLEKKKKNLLMLKMFFWVVCTLICLYGFVFWFNHPSFSISSVTVSEATFAASSDLLKEINGVLDEKYFGLFSKRNFLFVPSTSIRTRLLANNSSISEVFVNRESLHHLNIVVKEHEVVAKWCGRDARTESKPCYVVNRKGQFFAPETDAHFFEVPKLFGDVATTTIVGTHYLPIENFNNLINFVQKVPQLHIVVKTIETEDFETFAIHTVKGPYLLVEKNNEADQIYENLKIVIEQEEINKAQFQNLQYIDLRFGNKVFYKITTPLDPKT